MNENQREVVTSLMIQGFDDCAKEAGTQITGGQTVYNPWPMIGGVAIAAVSENEFIMPNNSQVGDVLVLTKLLGTQLAVNAMQWLKTNPENWSKVENTITKDEVIEAYKQAEKQMGTLNKHSAKLMKKYHANGATDVTGFGVYGHSNLLAQCQKQKVIFVIDKLPLIKNMLKIDKLVHNFKLLEGFSAETSGGLFISFPKDHAQSFVDELTSVGQYASIVGHVAECHEGESRAVFSENLSVIEF